MIDKDSSDASQTEPPCGAVDNVDKRSQSDKFKEAAREHEADEDEKHWEERLKKVAKQRPGNSG